MFQARHSIACSTLATCRLTLPSLRYENTSLKRCKWLCHATRKRRNVSGKCRVFGRGVLAADWASRLELSLLTTGLTSVISLDTRSSRLLRWAVSVMWDCQYCNTSRQDHHLCCKRGIFHLLFLFKFGQVLDDIACHRPMCIRDLPTLTQHFAASALTTSSSFVHSFIYFFVLTHLMIYNGVAFKHSLSLLPVCRVTAVLLILFAIIVSLFSKI